MPGTTPAVSYLRVPSSAPNDSVNGTTLQRHRISKYARDHGYDVVHEFHDGRDTEEENISSRPVFLGMLAWCLRNNVRCILVDHPSTISTSSMVWGVVHSMLGTRGFVLLPVSDPDAFTEAVESAQIKEMLSAFTHFDKVMMLAQLKAGRDRKRIVAGKCEGKKGYAETNPELVTEAKRLSEASPFTGTARSLSEIARELFLLGFKTKNGKPLSRGQVRRLIQATPRMPGARTSVNA